MDDFRAFIFNPAETVSDGSFDPTFNSVHFVFSYPLPPLHLRVTESPRFRRRCRCLTRTSHFHVNRWRLGRPTRRVQLVAVVGGVVPSSAHYLEPPLSATRSETRSAAFFHITITTINGGPKNCREKDRKKEK